MKIKTAADLGSLLRRVRKKSHLTQMQLAALSGVGARFVRELEQGKPTCQLDKALLIVHMLGIQLIANPPSILESPDE